MDSKKKFKGKNGVKPAGNTDGVVSKAEKKILRQQANSEWKNLDRMAWSDKDANPRHSLYYKAQLPELESEWSQLHAAMATDLPVTFRISERASPIVTAGIIKRLEKEFKKVRGRFVEVKGQVITNDLVVAIPWYPNAYQVSYCDSSTLSKQESLKPLHQYISREVSMGNIVRQELVSMIPAYMLNVKHNSVVLDMCAAPGSKTEQLVALMVQDNVHTFSHNGRASPEPLPPPSGMVVANDSDPKRIGTLLKRFAHSGSANLMFTCCRAEEFTKHFSAHVDTANGAIQSKFDRILCDVPCSGDGTFRKCPHLWRLFRPRGALDFHVIQLQIASAGLELLRTGGRFVYSTCSLNPLEDEAVVAALLLRYKGQIRLVDTSKEGLLPLLKSRPGISHWACNTDILTVGEPDEAKRQESVARLPKILKSMLPPTSEQAQSMHLDRCLRIVPHDQDTGGFFVAVFERIADAPPVVEKVNTASATTVVNQGIQIVNSKKSQPLSAAAALNGAGDVNQSISAMKRLGYNPKNLTGGSGAAAGSADIDAMGFLSACRDFSTSGVERVVSELHLDETRVRSGVPEDGNDGDDVDESAPGVLVLSEISKEFKAATTSNNKPTGGSGGNNKGEEGNEQNQAQQFVPKKPPTRFNGIFGSKSKGWAIQTEDSGDDSDSEAEHTAMFHASGPTHRVVLMSASVHEALHAWGKRLYIVQAGVGIATGLWRPESKRNLEAGFRFLSLDTRGESALQLYRETDRTVALNISDFLFALRHGLPSRFVPVTTVTTVRRVREGGDDDDDDDDDNSEQVGQKRSRSGGDEDEDGDDEATSDDGSQGSEEEEEQIVETTEFEDSFHIRRGYIALEQCEVPADVIRTDQEVLSCDGCAKIYDFIDTNDDDDNDVDDDEEVEAATRLNTTFAVTLCPESWAAICAKPSAQRDIDAAPVIEGEDVVDHSNTSQKKRLSKAEKKKLAKSGGAQGVKGQPNASATAAAAVSKMEESREPVSPEGLTFVLRYEKKLKATSKKLRRDGKPSKLYELILTVESNEDACESVFTTIRSHLKW